MNKISEIQFIYQTTNVVFSQNVNTTEKLSELDSGDIFNPSMNIR